MTSFFIPPYTNTTFHNIRNQAKKMKEDEEDERVLQEYRKQRLSQMKQYQEAARFGEMMEITAVDYVQDVNKAGEDIWVVLHLYKTGIPLCALLNRHLQQLAQNLPTTKFLKSISTICIFTSSIHPSTMT